MATVNLAAYDGPDIIGGICGNGYHNPSHNHCARFVGHALNLGFGYTCNKATGGSGDAADLRVRCLCFRADGVSGDIVPESLECTGAG